MYRHLWLKVQALQAMHRYSYMESEATLALKMSRGADGAAGRAEDVVKAEDYEAKVQ